MRPTDWYNGTALDEELELKPAAYSNWDRLEYLGKTVIWIAVDAQSKELCKFRMP